MYVPAHFEELRTEVLHDLIEEAPLGILFTHGRSGMDANHIPFHVSREDGQHGTLHCHVARANPVWQDIATGDEVLVVFRSADAYISPNWYPSKREFKKQVPTWNYTVAHAYGRVTIRDEERYVRTVIARLINRPLVVSPMGVRLCRPSEAVLEILPAPQRGLFAKEDGELVIDEAGNRVSA